MDSRLRMNSVASALRLGRERLANAGVEDAGLEAEVLLMAVLGIDRTAIYTYPDWLLSDEECGRFFASIRRRASGEPSAYIVGEREFFGLLLAVDRRVLIPRPETEALVEMALAFLTARAEPALLAVDVGTGSGAIAVSLAVRCPRLRIVAIDVSAGALEVARTNASRHGVGGQVELVRGGLVTAIGAPVHLIAANLPYIPADHLPALQREVREFEPMTALAGGPDGLALIRRLLDDAPRVLRPDGALLLEVGAGQAGTVAALVSHRFPNRLVRTIPDLAGIGRVVVVA